MRVLLTGASRGIGRAVAEALLARGARMALAVRDPASVAPLLAAAPGSAALPIDLRDRSATGALVDRALAALGGLDVLINCAGVVYYRSIAELPEREWLEQFEVNCFAACTLARAAALQMAPHGGGAIVNVASTLGLRPAPLTAAYAASKAALISFTRSLALEFGARQVRVNALAPGLIDTDMVRVVREPRPGVAPAQALEEQLAELRGLQPLGRLGSPEEIAQAVLFLIDARFVTGSVLVADGGLTLA